MKTKKFVTFVKKNFKIDFWKKKKKKKKKVKLEIIVIIQENIEVICISFIIWNILYLKKSFMVFKIDLTKIIILSKKVTRNILKTIYLFRRKYRKIHNS